MNMKKDEIISLIRTGYDKLILVIVLAVILVSLLILILSAGREKKSLADNQWEPSLVRPEQRSDKLSAEVCDAIEAVDINPLLVGEQGVVALDALVVLRPPATRA